MSKYVSSVHTLVSIILTYDSMERSVWGVWWDLVVGIQDPELGPIFKRVHLEAQLVQQTAQCLNRTKVHVVWAPCAPGPTSPTPQRYKPLSKLPAIEYVCTQCLLCESAQTHTMSKLAQGHETWQTKCHHRYFLEMKRLTLISALWHNWAVGSQEFSLT